MLYYLQKLLILDLSIFRFSTKIMLSFCGDFLKFLPPPSLKQAWVRKLRTPCVDTMQIHILVVAFDFFVLILFFFYFMALFSQSSFKHRLITSG